MNLKKLRELAQAALSCSKDRASIFFCLEEFREECEPSHIIAMLDVIEAAEAYMMDANAGLTDSARLKICVAINHLKEME